MDPIHPIVPVVPDILPILPTTKAGRIERESRRQAPDQQSRKRPPRGGAAPAPRRRVTRARPGWSPTASYRPVARTTASATST